MASCSGAVFARENPAVVDGVDVAPDFPLDQPLVLDLGCGNGVFLSGLATVRPDWNVLGVERKDYRVRQARRRAGRLGNAAVVHGEAADILSLMPEKSVAQVYLLFSDPWPKRRHAVRRMVQREFATLLATRLAPGGRFFFASDSRQYAAWTDDVFRSGGWMVSPWDVSPDWPRTEFEQRFVSAGVVITRLQAVR